MPLKKTFKIDKNMLVYSTIGEMYHSKTFSNFLSSEINKSEYM